MTKKIITLGVVAGLLAASGAAVAQAQYVTVTNNGNTVLATSEFSFLNSGMLSVGSSGTDVARLQGLLIELGYLTMPAGVAPGYFGTLTQSALMRYQTALGIPATGMFDTVTQGAVANYLARVTPAAVVATNNQSASTNTTTTGSNAQYGYWLNGGWYPVTTTTGGGNYSLNPSLTGAGTWVNGAWYPNGSTVATANGGNATIGTANDGSGQMGYWYNGVWYPTLTLNVGGNQSSDTTSMVNNSTGYWHQGVWYPYDPANDRPAPGYWHQGAWYPYDSSQANGYCLNGAFYPRT